jgi:hypothetical protein
MTETLNFAIKIYDFRHFTAQSIKICYDNNKLKKGGSGNEKIHYKIYLEDWKLCCSFCGYDDSFNSKFHLRMVQPSGTTSERSQKTS